MIALWAGCRNVDAGQEGVLPAKNVRIHRRVRRGAKAPCP